MKMEAVRYSGGIVKIPVAQSSSAEGAIPKIAIALREKCDLLYKAEQRIEELEEQLKNIC